METNMKLKPAQARHIFAIGGGLTKLPIETVAKLMDHLVLLSGKENPRVLIMNTACGDMVSEKLRVYEISAKMSRRWTVSFLTFFDRTPPDLRTLLLSQDIIGGSLVTGGNTKSMLAVWRAYDVDRLLHEAWKKGIILAGSSAGGIYQFEGCQTDSFADSFTSLPGLGFLEGSCCPHYSEPGRSEAYHAMVAAGDLPDGYGIDEATAIHFVSSMSRNDRLETNISEIVTVSPNLNAGAYRITWHDGVATIGKQDFQGYKQEVLNVHMPLTSDKQVVRHVLPVTRLV